MRSLIRFFRVYDHLLDVYENICSEIFLRIRCRRRGARRLLQCLFFQTLPRRKVLYFTFLFFLSLWYRSASWTFLPKPRDAEISNRNGTRAQLLLREITVLSPVFSSQNAVIPLTAMKCELATVVADYRHSTLKSDTLVACQQSDCGYWSSKSSAF